MNQATARIPTQADFAAFLNNYTRGAHGPALLNALAALRRHYRLTENQARAAFANWLND